MTRSTVTVAALQCSLGGKESENLSRIERLTKEAAAAGANVILPPELFEGPYFPQQQREEAFLAARPLKGHPTILRFAALAAELGVVFPVSFFEKAGPAYYNSVAMVDADGSVLGVYRKSHIPDGPGYQEKFYFRPGDTGFRSFCTQFGNIGVGICWDQWFPEAARAMTLRGADILLYPTAIGSEPHAPDLDTQKPWQRVMQGHAVANAVVVAAANRTGKEEGLTFYGSSFLCNHRGDLLSELTRDEEGFAIASIDLNQLQRERASFGFFRDRRPDLYQGLISPPTPGDHEWKKD